MQKNQQQSDFDYFFLIVVVGDSGVGKVLYQLSLTSLIRRFSEQQFFTNKQQYKMIKVDFKLRTVEIEAEIIKLQIMELFPAERFGTITQNHYYYKRTSGVILNFDVSNRISFDYISKQNEEIENYAQKKVIKYLIGNKIDLIDKREVSFEEGKALAQKLGVLYFETSSKENTNVESVHIKIGKNGIPEYLKKYSSSQQKNTGCITC